MRCCPSLQAPLRNRRGSAESPLPFRGRGRGAHSRGSLNRANEPQTKQTKKLPARPPTTNNVVMGFSFLAPGLNHFRPGASGLLGIQRTLFL
jgi:hypothetical protein